MRCSLPALNPIPKNPKHVLSRRSLSGIALVCCLGKWYLLASSITALVLFETTTHPKHGSVVRQPLPLMLQCKAALLETPVLAGG